ncbi:phage tail protein [Kribbella sp. NBC_01505]|uniref:phage tail protein n=1 Tax=Kribbella sp. NBC_01505 TaxID=2903580 RepID=UPI0038651483
MTVEQVPAFGVRFRVQIDDVELGLFTSCEGLGVQVVMEQRQEGGNNGLVWQLPSRVTYPTIKLTRPLTRDTERVARWIGGLATGVRRCTGQITAMSTDGTEVAKWSLLDVVPVRWTGPSIAPNTNAVLTETVEIAHHGFLAAN